MENHSKNTNEITIDNDKAIRAKMMDWLFAYILVGIIGAGIIFVYDDVNNKQQHTSEKQSQQNIQQSIERK